MTIGLARLTRRLGRLTAPETGLLPKILAAFVAVLALASLLTLLLETRLTRQQLQDQGHQLFAESGEILDGLISSDAVRTHQLMHTVAQGLASSRNLETEAVDDIDELARLTLSVVRTSDETLELAGTVDVATGRIDSLPGREVYDDPGPEAARHVADRVSSTQRVVQLRGGGYGVAYVLPIRPLATTPKLLVTGYPLDTLRARRFQRQTGVDEVEVVVGGSVVASTAGRVGDAPSGRPGVTRSTQELPNGRMVRYVAIGAERPWDMPAAIGLIQEAPLAALDGRLAQTRALMVVLLVVVGGALAFALARVMTRPIVRLTDTATAIAGGDLERSFSVNRRDEIGRLADALERMRRALRAQLLVIRRQAEALQESARRIVGVQDTERQRIAQDLHDGIQQQLVVLRMQVGVAKSQLEQEPGRVGEVTDALAGAIDQLLDQLRSTGQHLFPSILRDRGLGAALFSLAGRVEVSVDVVLQPDPLPRVDRDVEINAYFLASEAVTNALKHARADRIVVDVRHEGAVLRVAVIDDGRGFDPAITAHRGGLVHMRDRVNALGGSLQLVSRPGEGTGVTGVFPLSGSRDSVGGALKVEQDGGDAAVELELLGQADLAEDGVGVLLDRPVRDRQLPGDGGVPLA